MPETCLGLLSSASHEHIRSGPEGWTQFLLPPYFTFIPPLQVWRSHSSEMMPVEGFVSGAEIRTVAHSVFPRRLSFCHLGLEP